MATWVCKIMLDDFTEMQSTLEIPENQEFFTLDRLTMIRLLVSAGFEEVQ